MALIGRKRSGSELALVSVRIFLASLCRFWNVNVYVPYLIMNTNSVHYIHYPLRESPTRHGHPLQPKYQYQYQ